MLDFIYNTPTKIYFGKDKHLKIGEIISELGYNKIMMQYGKESIKKSGLYDQVISALNKNNIKVVELGGVEPNPKIEFVRNAIKIAKENAVQMILAVGGGSVIDSCKYTALGVKYDGDVMDFPLGKSTPKDALPVGCILTHSAAGSEMSNSAVITDLSTNKKKGCTTEFNRCKFAILNPELTYTISKYQTACGIVDIMSHTMERYFTVCAPTPLTDSFAESLLREVISAGKKVMENPTDYNGRATLMWASSLSHNGLMACGRENALAVHQLEHALSGKFDNVAHGAGLAVLFPAWAKYVYKYSTARFAQFARNVWGVLEANDEKASLIGIEKMSEFFTEIGMPTKLREFGIEPNNEHELTLLCTYNNTRIIKNYIPLGYKEIKEIFESCY